MLSGCGGAMPLAHPAHPLPAGKTTVGAGVAGRLLSSVSGEGDVGRMTELAIAPDLSPWVAARAGLGADFEGGVSASMRAIRIDGRRAFVFGNAALSLGLGLSALMAARPSGSSANGVYGAGFDVPVVAGWRSSADLYSVWGGLRFGGELFEGPVGPAAVDGSCFCASGRHLYAGGTLGMRAGLRHVYAVAEVLVAYHAAEGQIGPFGGDPVTLNGLSVTPSGGLVVSF